MFTGLAHQESVEVQQVDGWPMLGLL